MSKEISWNYVIRRKSDGKYYAPSTKNPDPGDYPKWIDWQDDIELAKKYREDLFEIDKGNYYDKDLYELIDATEYWDWNDIINCDNKM